MQQSTQVFTVRRVSAYQPVRPLSPARGDLPAEWGPGAYVELSGPYGGMITYLEQDAGIALALAFAWSRYLSMQRAPSTLQLAGPPRVRVTFQLLDDDDGEPDDPADLAEDDESEPGEGASRE